MRFEIFAPNARRPRTRSSADPDADPRGESDFFLATPPTGGTRRLADMARARVRGETRRRAGRGTPRARARNRAFERPDARGRAVCDYALLYVLLVVGGRCVP